MVTPEQDSIILDKEKKLEQLLERCAKVMVAFSGGVDSTFLLYKALTQLGSKNILAVTASSPIRSAAETDNACTLAGELKVPHRLIFTTELSREPFLENRPDRCYHCKKEFYTRLRAIPESKTFKCIIDGANMDDLSDYRPGTAASRASGVRSPLQEAALTKGEIRQLSRRYRLPSWNRPAESCLATRFPYGEKLEPGKIKRVEKAENFIRSLGLGQEIRVRSHGYSARIEVAQSESALVWAKKEEVAAYLKEIGFLHIALDLEGYFSGGVNRSLDLFATAPSDPRKTTPL